MTKDKIKASELLGEAIDLNNREDGDEHFIFNDDYDYQFPNACISPFQQKLTGLGNLNIRSNENEESVKYNEDNGDMSSS